ncbi:Pyoverdine/dityrosine biosynthesis protein [Actinoalloteichus fjordicus]|uniref:Pyoverdine/dityrosine biosynthesis protein n=2 Tax=Actinoalloteichus fjordicus TaxID=1612552 RepID=A0AAC9L8T9_9PSEU|nr:Pyoverdine/dityrosine biosynthesis protein [Actinoalloteichus fjordicus]
MGQDGLLLSWEHSATETAPARTGPSIPRPDALRPAPLARMAAEEVLTGEQLNTLLRDGGYPLTVVENRTGILLTGPGTGAGIRIRGPVDRLALYRVLVRLRQTRSRTDLDWQQDTVGQAEAGGVFRDRTVGDRRRFDVLGERHVVASESDLLPAVPRGPFALPCAMLPADRVDTLVPRAALPESLTDEARRRLHFLTNPDGTVTFPLVGGPDVAASRSPISHRTLVAELTSSSGTLLLAEPDLRGGRGPWRVELETEPGAAPLLGGSQQIWPAENVVRRQTQSTLDRCWSLTEILRTDPLLRLYAAGRPALLALVDAASGATSVLRSTQVYPAHPEFPGGTLSVSINALISGQDRHSPTLLQRALENRFERSESELDHFIEFVVRPIVTVFRVLVDRYGFDLSALHEKNVAVELSPELHLTGRMVLLDPAAPSEAFGPGDGEAGDGMRALYDLLGVLAVAFRRCTGWFDRYPAAEVRRAVTAVLVEELRFLRPDTAARLDTDHPLRRFVHSVSTTQDEQLKDVLAEVRGRTQARRAGQTRHRPSVLIQLGSSESEGSLPGLRRFRWDVSDAGGEVFLAKGGEIRQTVAQIKSRQCLETVAVIADSSANWPLLVREFPQAVRLVVGPSSAGVSAASSISPTIQNFETTPRPAAETAEQPRLSYACSLAGLRIGELRANRPARGQAVRLSMAESRSIVDALVHGADSAAVRVAANARRHLADRLDAVDSEREQTVLLIHHLLTRKQFIKGARSNYPPEQAMRDMSPFLARDAPIRMVITGFPIKHGQNGLKASGPLPDLAELGVLVRLRELAKAVAQIYPPGVRLTVLTDGQHFHSRPDSATAAYQRKLHGYLSLVGAEDVIELTDIDELADHRLSSERKAERRGRIRRYHRGLVALLAGLDVAEDPIGTLAAVARRAALPDHSVLDAGLAHDLLAALPDFFHSALYSTAPDVPPSVDSMNWSARVFADVFDVRESAADAAVLDARRQVLRRAWRSAVRYVVVRRADHDSNYEDVFPARVRLTNVPRPGRCGFSGLGGSGLLPWHGTGAVDRKGNVSTDFAVSLYDQAFVPVYSPLLGSRQPWMMVPITAARVVPGEFGARLDPAFANTIRLRRR